MKYSWTIMLSVGVLSAVLYCGAKEESELPAIGEQIPKKMPETDRAPNQSDILELADKIALLQLLPEDTYLTECIAADKDDAKEGYDSSLSYPGHRKAGLAGGNTMHGYQRRRRTENDGPRLRACEEKWEPIRRRNFELRMCRKRAIRHLKEAMKIQREKMDAEAFAAFAAEVARRAGLTESEMHDAGITLEPTENSATGESDGHSDKRQAGTEQ